MHEGEEKFNPYVNVGIVAKMKIQDVGRLEQFILSIFGAELIFMEKVPKHIFLKILREPKVGGEQ